MNQTILIDLKKERIRIHRNTIRALGDPEAIVLIMNPKTQTLGIKCSSSDNRRAHKIRKQALVGKNSYELHSRALSKALLSVCPEWDKNANYRITGVSIPEEQMICFAMSEAIAIKQEEKDHGSAGASFED